MLSVTQHLNTDRNGEGGGGIAEVGFLFKRSILALISASMAPQLHFTVCGRDRGTERPSLTGTG